MRRNCIYNYITKNKPQKDIVVYEYGNCTEYLIHHAGHSCYHTYCKNTMEEISDNNLLKLIWCNSNILCDYITDIIALQVNFGR